MSGIDIDRASSLRSESQNALLLLDTTPTHPLPTSIPFLRSSKVPLHDRSEDSLAPSLNDISVTRNNPVKVPLVDPLGTGIIPLAISGTDRIPNEPLLPNGSATGIVQRHEQPREEATRRTLARFRHLLGSRKVEDVVCLDHSLALLVAEDNLLVRVRVHVLGQELGVKGAVDAVACAWLEKD